MSRDRPPPNRSDSFPEHFPDDHDPRSWTGDNGGAYDDLASESALPDFAGVGPDTNAFLHALDDDPDEVHRPGSFAPTGSNGITPTPAMGRGGFGDESEIYGHEPEDDSFTSAQPASNGYGSADPESEFYAGQATSNDAGWVEADPYPEPLTRRGLAPITSEIERFEQENYVNNRSPAEPVEQPRTQTPTSSRGGFDDDDDDYESYAGHNDDLYRATNQDYDDYVETNNNYYGDEENLDQQQQDRDNFRASVFDQNVDYYEPNQQRLYRETERPEIHPEPFRDVPTGPFRGPGGSENPSANDYADDRYVDGGYDDEDDYYDEYPDNERHPEDSRRPSSRRSSYATRPGRTLARSRTSKRDPASRLRRSGRKGRRSTGFVVEQKSREHRIRDQIVELAFLVVPTILLVVLVRTFVVSPLIVPTESMEPTLEIGDRVLVNKLSYRVGEIGRGDLVVARDTTSEPGVERDIVKRVIALPGEVVKMRDNTVIINGNLQLNESEYLAEDVISEDFGPVQVPQGELFLLGDNRQVSSDSRNELGTVPVEMVEGRAFLRWWPAGRFGAL